MKPTIVPHWRLILKQWSFWLGIAGAALTSAFVALPQFALEVWLMMPPDLKATLPEKYTPLIGVGVFVLSLISKFITQARLEAERNRSK